MYIENTNILHILDFIRSLLTLTVFKIELMMFLITVDKILHSIIMHVFSFIVKNVVHFCLNYF